MVQPITYTNTNGGELGATVTVHANSTVTTSDSAAIAYFSGPGAVMLFVNITAAPTGTSPTLTFSMQEVDPGDQLTGLSTTLIGTAVTGAALTGVGTQTLIITPPRSGWVKVSWTIGGTTPSFTGVYSTLININPPVQVFAPNSLAVSQRSSRALTGAYSAAMGTATAGTVIAQNLMSIENPAASTITVYVKRAQFVASASGNVVTQPLYKLTRTTALTTGGTTLTAQKRRTADPAAQAIVRSGPTGTAAAGFIWASPASADIGQHFAPNPNVAVALAGLHEDDDVFLAPGEALLFLVDANDTNYLHHCAVSWQEGTGGWT